MSEPSNPRLYEIAVQWIYADRSTIDDARQNHKLIDQILNESNPLPKQYKSIYPDETEGSVRKYLEIRLEGSFKPESFLSLFVQHSEFGHVIWDDDLKSRVNILKRELDVYNLFALFIWTYANLPESTDGPLTLAKLRPTPIVTGGEGGEEEEDEEEDNETRKIDIQSSFIDDRMQFLKDFKNYVWLFDEHPELEENNGTVLMIDFDKPGYILMEKEGGEQESMLINATHNETLLTNLRIAKQLQKHPNATEGLGLSSSFLGTCQFCSVPTKNKMSKLFFCNSACYNLYKGQ